MILSKGRTTQRAKINNEVNIPAVVPKKSLKTAPVYPKRAEMSSFSKMSILERSMGLNIVAKSENFSNGYSLNITRDIKNKPS